MFRKSVSLYNVMTLENKEKLINIRVKELQRDEFRVAAELRGATMSTLIHQFIVKTIREEKERDPDEFKLLLKEVRSQSEKENAATNRKEVKDPAKKGGSKNTQVLKGAGVTLETTRKKVKA